MRELVAPNVDTAGKVTEKWVFLAGGITNCWDWQRYAINYLQKYNLHNVLFINPRRDKWDMNADQEESRKQILWEHKYLLESDIIFFWFPPETLCPITLFELGAALERYDNLIVACDPDYQRKFDVEVQAKLVQPDLTVYSSLDEALDELVIKINSLF